MQNKKSSKHKAAVLGAAAYVNSQKEAEDEKKGNPLPLRVATYQNKGSQNKARHAKAFNRNGKIIDLKK